MNQYYHFLIDISVVSLIMHQNLNCELHGHKDWASDELGLNEVWYKQQIELP